MVRSNSQSDLNNFLSFRFVRNISASEMIILLKRLGFIFI